MVESLMPTISPAANSAPRPICQSRPPSIIDAEHIARAPGRGDEVLPEQRDLMFWHRSARFPYSGITSTAVTSSIGNAIALCSFDRQPLAHGPESITFNDPGGRDHFDNGTSHVSELH